MKVIFLGTNGWFDTDTGNTICTLIKTKEMNLVLDAGNGIYKLDNYLDARKPTFIFLSHIHLDHIFGLHALAKFKFNKALTIYVPPGASTHLKSFIAHPFTMPYDKLCFKVYIKTVFKMLRLPGVKVAAFKLIHSSTCFGYRFKINKKIIAYCTDTGICPNAFKLASKADLLITECALKKGEEDRNWPHLNPEDAAFLAKRAKAKQLVLTHFDAYNYQSKKERKIAQAEAKKTFIKTVSAFDGMEIVI